MTNDDPFDELPDDDFVRDLLGSLELDEPDEPVHLEERTIRKVQAELTSRDLVDLTTFVFLMRFCAPLLDLLAAFFGHDPLAPPSSMAAPRANDEPLARATPRASRVTEPDRSAPDE